MIFSTEWISYLDLFDFYDFGDMPISSDKCCFIIEPRNDPLLLKVMKQFMFFLAPKGWGLVFGHGNLNEHVGDNIPYIKKIPLGVNNLSISQYNQYMTHPSLWQRLIDMGIQTVLVFQLDTLLFHSNIEPFLQYDYVGAPWKRPICGQRVGNGGLSLRNVLKMRSICETFPRGFSGNEDVFFSVSCHRLQYSIPSLEVAKTFSVETIYYNDPLGLHKPHFAPELVHGLIAKAQHRFQKKYPVMGV